MKTVVWFAGLGLVLLLAQGAASWLPETLRPDPLLVFALAMGLRGSSVSSLAQLRGQVVYLQLAFPT